MKSKDQILLEDAYEKVLGDKNNISQEEENFALEKIRSVLLPEEVKRWNRLFEDKNFRTSHFWMYVRDKGPITLEEALENLKKNTNNFDPKNIEYVVDLKPRYLKQFFIRKDGHGDLGVSVPSTFSTGGVFHNFGENMGHNYLPR